MNWFFIAIGAPILWAIVNIADQYLVEKHSKGVHPSGALALFSSLIGVLIAIGIALFTPDLGALPLLSKVILFGAGILNAVWIMLYLYALEADEVSSIAAWFLTVPVFSYILGHFILGETLTQAQLIGGAIILMGALILSLDFTEKHNTKFKTKATLFMVVACALIALSGVLFKFVTEEGSFWVSSFWEYAGLGATGLSLFFFKKSYRTSFLSMIRTGGAKIFSLNIGSEAITIIGNMLTNFALLLVPVTLVYLVDSYQPVIVLLLTFICTKYFPFIVKEKFAFRSIVPKLIAIGVMIVGTYQIFK